MDFYKDLKSFFIFLLIFAWVFTSTPLIWKIGNWRIPSEIGKAEAASSGPNNPSTAGTEAGGGTVDWTSPTNIYSSDNNRATASLGKGIISYYLKGTNFNFSIPSNARIDGIKVEIERSIAEATSNVKDNSVKIIKGGTISGNEYADTGTLWPVNSSDAYATYGGTSDL